MLVGSYLYVPYTGAYQKIIKYYNKINKIKLVNNKRNANE